METPPETKIPLVQTNTATPVTRALLLLLVSIYLWTVWSQWDSVVEARVLPFIFDPLLFQQGQWWRLLTANFLHANLSHLLQNGFGLLILGNMLEPLIGARRMLLLLVASGIACMGFSLYLVPQPTLGASGMVMGLLGCYLTLSLLIERRVNPTQFKAQLRGIVLFCLIFMISDTFQRVGVNAWGHLGGFTAGVVMGLLVFSMRLMKPSSKENAPSNN